MINTVGELGVSGAGLSLEEVTTERLKNISELVEIQKKILEDDKKKTDYNIGLYNGLLLAVGVLTGNEPEFYKDEES